MQKKLHHHFVLTLSGLFIVLVALACIGFVNEQKIAAHLDIGNSFSDEEGIRRLITEITIQRLDLNSSFDRYLQACLNKIRITKQDNFDTKNINQFLLYNLELQHRFHAEIKRSISNNFKPGRQLKFLNEQLQTSEQEVGYFEENLLLENSLLDAQNAERLIQLIQETHQKKVTLQQKLRALLTGVKYTEFDHANLKKSSQGTLIFFIMTLLTGAGIGILLSYTYIKNTYFTSPLTLQLTGQVIKIIEGESIPVSKKVE